MFARISGVETAIEGRTVELGKSEIKLDGEILKFDGGENLLPMD